MPILYEEYLTGYERERLIEEKSFLSFLNKIDLLYEAAEVSYRANLLSAEAKVLTEGGTYEELIMLYEAAEEEANEKKGNILQRIIKKIKDMLDKIFGKVKEDKKTFDGWVNADPNSKVSVPGDVAHITDIDKNGFLKNLFGFTSIDEINKTSDEKANGISNAIHKAYEGIKDTAEKTVEMTRMDLSKLLSTVIGWSENIKKITGLTDKMDEVTSKASDSHVNEHAMDIYHEMETMFMEASGGVSLVVKNVNGPNAGFRTFKNKQMGQVVQLPMPANTTVTIDGDTYTFDGYFLNGSSSSTPITEWTCNGVAATVVGKWTKTSSNTNSPNNNSGSNNNNSGNNSNQSPGPNDCKISFIINNNDYKGKQPQNIVVKQGETVSSLPKLSDSNNGQESKQFRGWSIDGDNIINASDIKTNKPSVELTALWDTVSGNRAEIDNFLTALLDLNDAYMECVNLSKNATDTAKNAEKIVSVFSSKVKTAYDAASNAYQIVQSKYSNIDLSNDNNLPERIKNRLHANNVLIPDLIKRFELKKHQDISKVSALKPFYNAAQHGISTTGKKGPIGIILSAAAWLLAILSNIIVTILNFAGIASDKNLETAKSNVADKKRDFDVAMHGKAVMKGNDEDEEAVEEPEEIQKLNKEIEDLEKDAEEIRKQISAAGKNNAPEAAKQALEDVNAAIDIAKRQRDNKRMELISSKAGKMKERANALSDNPDDKNEAKKKKLKDRISDFLKGNKS